MEPAEPCDINAGHGREIVSNAVASRALSVRLLSGYAGSDEGVAKVEALFYASICNRAMPLLRKTLANLAPAMPPSQRFPSGNTLLGRHVFW